MSNNWTITELAYMAGIIDGEGSITIFDFRYKHLNNRPSSILRLSIYNTNLDLMNWIAVKFGGRVGKVKRRRIQHKQSYIWEKNGRKAAIIIEACLPYFKVKCQQAAVFIEVAKTIKHRGINNPVPAKIIEFRSAAAKKVQQLNAKGRRDAS